MAAKSESAFATPPSNSVLWNNDNDGTAISPPKDLDTDGSVSGIRVQPSTPRFNSKDTSILTPDNTPPPPPLFLNDSTTCSTDPISERVFSSFGKLSLSDHFISTSPPINCLSKLDTSPGTPILTRDHKDVKPTRTAPHLHDNDLNFKYKDLSAHYQTLQLYRRWTSHLVSHLTSSSIPIVRATPPPSHLPENELATAKSELEDLITGLLSVPLSPTFQTSDTNTDTLLYRVHTPRSKSPYTRFSGFRCSGWETTQYTSDTAGSRQSDGQAFQAHCNATPDPSPYISVHTSIARLVKFISDCRIHGEASSRVYVISLTQLRQLGIKAESTNSYLENFVDSEGKRVYKPNGWETYHNGVSYVTDSHWLVEGWIPAQTIVSEMDCAEFLETAEREGISRWAIRKNAKSNFWDSDLEARKINLGKWPKKDVRVGRDWSEQEEVIITRKPSIRIVRRKKPSSPDSIAK